MAKVIPMPPPKTMAVPPGRGQEAIVVLNIRLKAVQYA